MGQAKGWFEDADCSNDAERLFVRALSDRAVGWKSFGVDEDAIQTPGRSSGIVLGVDISDTAPIVVLRTLRVEFDGTRALVGDDQTMQLVTSLDPRSRDVTIFAERSPEACAIAVAEWIEQQLRRPIHRQEWIHEGLHHVVWLLADTGSKLIEMTDLGSIDGLDLDAPDVVTVVRDYGRAG